MSANKDFEGGNQSGEEQEIQLAENKSKLWKKLGGVVLVGTALLGPLVAVSLTAKNESNKPKDANVAFIKRGVPIKPDETDPTDASDLVSIRNGIKADSIYGIDCYVADANPDKKKTNFQPVQGKYVSEITPLQFTLTPNVHSTLSGGIVYENVFGKGKNSVDSDAISATVKTTGPSTVVEVGEDLTFANSQTESYTIPDGYYLATRDHALKFVIANNAGHYSLTAACDLGIIKANAGEIPFDMPDSLVTFGKQ